MRTLAIVSLSLSLATLAAAQQLNAITVGDLPRTEGQWQVGEVTVAAPSAEVQHWFTDAARWPQRFPDDQWARVLGRAPDGRLVVEFRSKIIGRTVKLHLRDKPGLITYDGVGKGINTQGKIFIQALGPTRTKIVMQTTGELHGAIGMFASEGMKRKKALAKLRADLEAAVRLSRASAAAPRSGG
ncbi:MAG TPA: SRPBCC family protein [Polyangia bacterium]